MTPLRSVVTALLTLTPLWAADGVALPDSLVADGIPAVPAAIAAKAGRYQNFRGASFSDWHPTKREMIIATRLAEVTQAHRVAQPLGMRQQLTFTSEPVGGGSYVPPGGDQFLFSMDQGGTEQFQFYVAGVRGGDARRITDGKSRNVGAKWSADGKRLSYSSTARNGRDFDIYVAELPELRAKLVYESKGMWSALDWSPDNKSLLLAQYVSINESHLHRLTLEGSKLARVTPEPGKEQVAYGAAAFSADGKGVYVTTDRESEFQRLARIEIATGKHDYLTSDIPWDVDEFDLSRDGKRIAFVTNEAGVGVLHLFDVATGKARKVAGLPVGIPSGLEWHRNGEDLAFTFTSARASADVYSVHAGTGAITRWTESETGGVETSVFPEPKLARFASFDKLEISAFVYLPDPQRFPPPYPVIVDIHGGPEGQFRPIFLASRNYFPVEQGVAMVFPNVRGSSGYGKTFLTLDNGMKREDSVKDIGALLDWIAKQRDLDAKRVMVRGGSYGGYMSLACMIHHAPRLRCGFDAVGISNFVTFLNNTSDYRRDLRRVEYGDERDAAMRAHLEKISPNRRAQEIRSPLFVVQGANDPRVPQSESEQMVASIRGGGGKVWYLLAKDEGHGFAKKKNRDFLMLAEILFVEQHLLGPSSSAAAAPR